MLEPRNHLHPAVPARMAVRFGRGKRRMRVLDRAERAPAATSYRPPDGVRRAVERDALQAPEH